MHPPRQMPPAPVVRHEKPEKPGDRPHVPQVFRTKHIQIHRTSSLPKLKNLRNVGSVPGFTPRGDCPTDPRASAGCSGNLLPCIPCLLYTSPSPRDGLLSRM